MLSVNQLQIPPSSREPLYALYSLVHDRIIITHPDIKIVDDLATILSSKIVLDKFDLAQGKNWTLGMIDNSNCQNWGLRGHDLDFASPQVVNQPRVDTFDQLAKHDGPHGDLEIVIQYSRLCLDLLNKINRLRKNFKSALRLDFNEQSRKIFGYYDDVFVAELKDFTDNQHATSEKEVDDLENEIKKICYWSYDQESLKTAVYNIGKRNDRASKFFFYNLNSTWI